MILLLLPVIFINFLPIGLAIYFTFSKKHRDEAGCEYHAWMDDDICG